MTKQTITIDLVEYLRDDLQVFQHYDTTAVSVEKGKLIASLDKEEQYVYVEFTTNKDDKEIAIVWDKRRWKESSELTERQKAASERHRQQFFLDDDNIKIVSAALAKVTGIKHAELLRPLAVEIIKKQKFDSLPCLNLCELKVRID